jgi:F-type H+-transporting ATPase subunit epsilon
MATLNVEIVTPERRVASLTADEVVAPAANGLYGVLPGHSAFLSVLSAGPLTVRTGTQTEGWFVAGGFFEVSEDTVRILADSAEPLASLDVEGARTRASARPPRRWSASGPGCTRPSTAAEAQLQGPLFVSPESPRRTRPRGPSTRDWASRRLALWDGVASPRASGRHRPAFCPGGRR